MIDIEKLKALHEAATGEGWVPVSGYTDFGARYNGIDGAAGNWSPVVGERDMSQPDIELTCFLRNAVPSIIDMAYRLTRYEAALREMEKNGTAMLKAFDAFNEQNRIFTEESEFIGGGAIFRLAGAVGDARRALKCEDS